MPGLLDALEKNIDQRFALYRAMSALALQDEDPGARGFDPEVVRVALKTCLACRETRACAAWLAIDHPDVPLFCRARPHFLQLAASPHRSDGPRREVAGSN